MTQPAAEPSRLSQSCHAIFGRASGNLDVAMLPRHIQSKFLDADSTDSAEA
jgi:hypothetical protein